MSVVAAEFLCALVGVGSFALALVLGRKGTTLPKRPIYLLFPISQLAIAGFLLVYVAVFQLPLWLFAAIAASAALCAPADLMLFKALRETEEAELAQTRTSLLEEQVEAQRQYIPRLSAELARAHDVRAELLAQLEEADALLARRQGEQASAELTQAVSALDPADPPLCAHRAVDALVSLKAHACEEAGIRATFELDVPSTVPVPSVDLCAVFSNLLDNALHACEKVEQPRRRLHLKARVVSGYLVVEAENSCLPDPGGPQHQHQQLAPRIPASEQPLAPTTPERRPARGLAEHGWGLSILESLATRHEGSLSIEQSGGVFRTTVALKMNGR